MTAPVVDQAFGVLVALAVPDRPLDVPIPTHQIAPVTIACRPRQNLGVRALLVDALHEKAARFYRAYGFREATANSHTLYLPLGNV